ncbi:uncharacterized protein LOC117173876 [Belonocnema kinseyi]|uniref:uncharacterized protein LOC117173876 n=1 Tax=Belonocnema kinseyi TaxID=2817044 RepID=UPI00143CDD50|nr:uncharacterized protein LOC117173876 [Belonocnema kinseyi]
MKIFISFLILTMAIFLDSVAFNTSRLTGGSRESSDINIHQHPPAPPPHPDLPPPREGEEYLRIVPEYINYPDGSRDIIYRFYDSQGTFIQSRTTHRPPRAPRLNRLPRPRAPTGLTRGMSPQNHH